MHRLLCHSLPLIYIIRNVAEIDLYFYRLYLLEKFQIHSETEYKVQKYFLLPYICSFHSYQYPPPEVYICQLREPTLAPYYHSETTVYMRVHSSCCTTYKLRKIYDIDLYFLKQQHPHKFEFGICNFKILVLFYPHGNLLMLSQGHLLLQYHLQGESPGSPIWVTQNQHNGKGRLDRLFRNHKDTLSCWKTGGSDCCDFQHKIHLRIRVGST